MTTKVKILTATVSGVVALAITATAICIGLNKPLSAKTSDNTLKDSTNVVVSVPTTNDISDVSSKKPNNGQITLDVGCNPTSISNNSTDNNNSQKSNNNSSINASNSSSSQKPPSVTTDTSKDTTQPKDTTPAPNPPTTSDPNYPTNPDDWTPPPPGVGTGEIISEGFENEPIDISANITTLQTSLSLIIGDELLNSGYNTLIPNAGSTKQLVEDAVKVYADTENVRLNPASYGLPKLITSYNIKIKAQGTNALESGKYIANYMKNDAIFNNLVTERLGIPKDGYVAVYQKDGYFYVLFAVIDKGYSSFN
jgi:hypothetical protein